MNYNPTEDEFTNNKFLGVGTITKERIEKAQKTRAEETAKRATLTSLIEAIKESQEMRTKPMKNWSIWGKAEPKDVICESMDAEYETNGYPATN